MKMAKRMVTALLALVMALSLASCSDTSWVVKSGDETISAGVYLSYLFDAYYGQAYTYAYTGQDPSAVFDKQIEEKDAAQWMKDTAMESLKKNIVYRNYMEELGLSFTDEEIENANKQADSMYDQLTDSLKQGGVGKQSFETFFQQSMAASKVFSGLYGEGGTKEVPVDDIRTYWEENYYRVKVISSSLLDDTGAALSDTDKQVITDRLDGYKDQINNGEATMDELIETEKKVQEASSSSSSGSSSGSSSSSSSAAEEEEEETDTASYVSKSDETMPERTEALEGLEPGQAATFTSNNVYYVVQLLPYDGDDAALVDQTFESNQSSLLQEMKGEEFDSDINTRVENLEVTINDAAVKRYDPKKFIVE